MSTTALMEKLQHIDQEARRRWATNLERSVNYSEKEFAIPPGLHSQEGHYYFPGDSPPPFNNSAFIDAFAPSFTSFIINLDPRIKGRKPVKGKSRRRRKMKTRTTSDRHGHLGKPMLIGDQERNA
ncbi:hypothetical protein DFH08DRAFT_820052 [Mycena albidolilacea]|uniref:Uncharacterized protein n=1 Tax=Mycena albidolilacea TaxID=1033008 RepID=A0AAD7EEE2_9AGAR|nr:hypothetical protein DFH08DRAFT_820052 [Mycena albidolilacea]